MEHAEEWRPIDGYEGAYEVSNLGHVRSLKFRKVRMLAFKDNLCGYFKVGLHRDGAEQLPYVHRLVALAFLPRPSHDRVQVNHINWDTTDNRVDNLEWVTSSENAIHTNKRRRKRAPDEIALGVAVDALTLGCSTKATAMKWSVTTRFVRGIKSGKTHAKLTAHLRNG